MFGNLQIMFWNLKKKKYICINIYIKKEYFVFIHDNEKNRTGSKEKINLISYNFFSNISNNQCKQKFPLHPLSDSLHLNFFYNLPPLKIIYIGQKWPIFWCWWSYPHQLRDSVSPHCVKNVLLCQRFWIDLSRDSSRNTKVYHSVELVSLVINITVW